LLDIKEGRKEQHDIEELEKGRRKNVGVKNVRNERMYGN
jgi:hypothetical protein